MAKWEGGCLQNSPIVGSIPTRASIVVSTGVRAGLISLQFAPDEGARQSSILWTTTKVSAPVVQWIRTVRYERTDRGSNPLGGAIRARAANRTGHQPPKLAICEFESHRAFHPAIAQWQSRRPIIARRGFDFLSRDHSGLAQQVVRSAVNREDLSSNLRAGARLNGSVAQQAERPPFKRGDAGSTPAAPTNAAVAQW